MYRRRLNCYSGPLHHSVTIAAGSMYRRNHQLFHPLADVARIPVDTLTCRKCCNISAMGSIGDRRVIELRLIKAKPSFPS